MNDRLIRGGIAGMLGQIGIMAVNFPSKLLFHFSRHLWAEYVSVLIFGHPPKGLPETLVAFTALFLFAGIFGAGFSAMMVLFPDQPNYILRGVGWAYAIWISTFSLGSLYKMPLFSATDWPTSLTQFVAVTVYGTVIGGLVRLWDMKYGYPKSVTAKAETPPDHNQPPGGRAKSARPGPAGRRLAFQESSDEFGGIGDKLDLIADRLCLIAGRMEGIPDLAPDKHDGEAQSEDGWLEVPHLGFHRVKPDEGDGEGEKSDG